MIKPKPHPDQRPVTGWISGDEKPLSDRPDLYQRKSVFGAVWARWTGVHWIVSFTNQARAAQATRISHNQSAWPWRGIPDPRTITPSQPKG